ncbi:MAG: HAMP domain-containing protein [Deltaproteobacteria bacterium]|nr:HAMP domain-containing protein [Deltaproteobacteria bacterium]
MVKSLKESGAHIGFGIKAKFLAMVFLLFAIVVVNFFIMLMMLETQRQDAFLINIAGRQRMLSQLILKLANRNLLEKNRLLNSRAGGSADTLKEITASRLHFHNIAHAMMNGGDVTDALGNTVRIKKVESVEAVAALNEMRLRWRLFDDILLNDLIGNGGIAASTAAFKRLDELDLLGSIDTAVNVIAREAEEKVTLLRNIQIIVLGFGFALLGAVIWFFRVSVLRPVERLVETVMAIGDGDVGRRAVVMSGDEIGFLARSFNAAMDNLEKTTVSRDYLGHVVNAICDSLIVTNRNREIVMVNPATAQLLGNADEKEIIGLRVDEIAVAAAPTKRNRRLFTPQTFEKLLEQGFIRNYNVAYRGKTGNLIPVSFSASILHGKAGGFDGLVCVAKDMREYNMMQSSLMQSAKLAALGTMSAGMAHELKTPLTVVKGKAQFLIFQLMEGKEPSKDDIIKDMELVIASSDRMASIINHLRNFSRESKDRDWTYLSVEEVIDDSLILIGKRLKGKGITLVRDIPAGLPQIWGDRNKLISVFQNLMSNSFDAFEPVTDAREKTIRISVAPEEGDKLRVTFEDNASGMEKEILNNIFTPFFTTKDVGKGTGLGLSLLYGIIEEHGGNVTVTSVPDKGTAFTIVFRLNGQNARNGNKAAGGRDGQ